MSNRSTSRSCASGAVSASNGTKCSGPSGTTSSRVTPARSGNPESRIRPAATDAARQSSSGARHASARRWTARCRPRLAACLGDAGRGGGDPEQRRGGRAAPVFEQQRSGGDLRLHLSERQPLRVWLQAVLPGARAALLDEREHVRRPRPTGPTAAARSARRRRRACRRGTPTGGRRPGDRREPTRWRRWPARTSAAHPRRGPGPRRPGRGRRAPSTALRRARRAWRRRARPEARPPLRPAGPCGEASRRGTAAPALLRAGSTTAAPASAPASNASSARWLSSRSSA